MGPTNDLPPKERRKVLAQAEKSEGRSSRLRCSMSLPEVLLWNQLKGNKTGFSFRRQHPMGSFVADFYCHEALLIVEVDGQFHYNQMEDDARRDAWFRERGIEVARVDAKVVLDSPSWAAADVRSACERRVKELAERRGERERGVVGRPPPARRLATPSASAEGDRRPSPPRGLSAPSGSPEGDL